MAERQDTEAAVSDALEEVGDNAKRRKATHQARRTKAVSMALAGLSFEQIGEELGISLQAAHSMVNRTIEETRNTNVDELRQVENARLDRAQAAIWSDVLKGDQKAINTFLRISERRAKMNGLDAPSKVQMSVEVRQEMQQALTQLEEVILESGEPAPNPNRHLDVAEAEMQQALNQDYFTNPVTGEHQSA